MHRLLRGALLTASLTALGSGRADAQTPVHVVVGPTFGSVSSDEYETSSSSGFFLALGTSFAVGERVSIQPNVGYVKKPTEFDDGSTGSYDYLEIPILLTVRVPVGESAGVTLGAGPQVGFNIGCDEDGFDCSEYEDFKSTAFGFVASAAVGFPLSPAANLIVGASADFGLSNVYEDLSYKTRTFGLFAGLGFTVGG